MVSGISVEMNARKFVRPIEANCSMSVNIDSAAANLTAADVAADQMQRSPIAAGVEEAEAEAAQTRLGADGSSSASEASESDDEHEAYMESAAADWDAAESPGKQSYAERLQAARERVKARVAARVQARADDHAQKEFLKV